MQSEWTVVLAAFAVVLGFTIWVAQRSERNDAHKEPLHPLSADDAREGRRQSPVAMQIPKLEPKWVGDQIVTNKANPRLLTNSEGRPIGANDEVSWLVAHQNGVTALDIEKIVQADGRFGQQRAGLLDAKLRGQVAAFLPLPQRHVDWKLLMRSGVTDGFEFEPNTLLCAGENPRHLASPSGIGDGLIAEYRMSRQPLIKAQHAYRDQLQWQLHVTRSERLLFVVDNPSTYSQESCWVERDDYRILILTSHADAFLEELDKGRAISESKVALLTGKDSPTAPYPAKTPGKAAPVRCAEPMSLDRADHSQSAPESDTEPPQDRPVIPREPAAGSPVLLPPLLNATKVGRRREPEIAPETIVSGIDSDNDSDDNRSWSQLALRELLRLYGDNEDMGVVDLARQMGTTSRAIVIALTEILFDQHGSIATPSFPRRPWTQGEVDDVHDLYRAGDSLYKIAQSVSRTQLSVAFRLLEDRVPETIASIEEFAE